MSDLRLKDKSLVPDKGWRAVQPETGRVITAPGREKLAKMVRDYRAANGLVIENNFNRQIENQICLAMSPDEQNRRCRYLSDDDLQNPKDMRKWKAGKQDLKKFAIAVKETLAAHVAGREVHVSKEVATERAQICAKCEDNLPIAPCFGCGELGALYSDLVSTSMETPVDPHLDSCGVCGCNLKLKVHLSEGVLKAIGEKNGETPETYPAWCWMRKVLSKNLGLKPRHLWRLKKNT